MKVRCQLMNSNFSVPLVLVIRFQLFSSSATNLYNKVDKWLNQNLHHRKIPVRDIILYDTPHTSLDIVQNISDNAGYYFIKIFNNESWPQLEVSLEWVKREWLLTDDLPADLRVLHLLLLQALQALQLRLGWNQYEVVTLADQIVSGLLASDLAKTVFLPQVESFGGNYVWDSINVRYPDSGFSVLVKYLHHLKSRCHQQQTVCGKSFAGLRSFLHTKRWTYYLL